MIDEPAEPGDHVTPPVATRLADLGSEDDLAIVIELLDMYAREPMGQAAPLPPDVRRRLAVDLPKQSNLFVVLAEREAVPLGLAVCLVGYSTFLAKPLVNIHDLAVAPAARGCGVGRKLLERVASEAKDRRCARVTLEVRSDNAPARSLYRQVGFSGGEGSHWHEFWTKPLTSDSSDTNG